ncbi:DUF11 domain-containing protein [Micromonospora auratinigra]|uniref:Uncharacterized protein n=1 Tax=Micromonospora auratinigra TaxID=261654 RepID=A0A1A9A4B6_9ACTN|nr:DUF11 domain-containing protein [Micromonospora auratinigra]SBT51052.1 hypothetical protein GA0070611_5002 [Micromonospora auratinigra]
MTSQRILRTGTTLLCLAAAATLAPTAPALAGPAPRADLRIGLSTTETQLDSYGRAVAVVRATVDNVGAAAADDATISFRLPAGTTIAGETLLRCDYATSVCTGSLGPVPAGGSAEPLRVYLALPMAPAGTVATIDATVSTTAREVTRTNNTAAVRTTYGRYADLSLYPGADTGVWAETDISPDGGPIQPLFTAKNNGTGPAADVRLVVEVPPGFTVTGPPTGDTAWQCDVSATQVACVAGPLDPAATVALTVPMTAPAGNLDDRFSVPARVTTSGVEWRDDNGNDATADYHYVTPQA